MKFRHFVARNSALCYMLLLRHGHTMLGKVLCCILGMLHYVAMQKQNAIHVLQAVFGLPYASKVRLLGEVLCQSDISC